MTNLAEFANKSGFTARPISVKSVVRKFGVASVRDAIATFSIKDFHRRTGADYGPLGVAVDAVRRTQSGGYEQQTQLGSIRLTDISAAPSGEADYDAEVTLSGIRCFGTQDIGPDETYAVIWHCHIGDRR